MKKATSTAALELIHIVHLILPEVGIQIIF